MDWIALSLSMKLAGCTLAVLLPLGLWLGRGLVVWRVRGKAFYEALLALPLVLPPTVLGYYLLAAMGAGSPVGVAWQWLTGGPLVFTFEALVLASILFNLPFAVQPVQRAFEAIPQDVRDAAACCGMSGWRAFLRIELPLAWPGVLSAMVISFAHTLGEFGVVLMVGGSIPGETRTIAISIYDSVQSFDNPAAAAMSAVLLAISAAAIGASYLTARRPHGARG